MDTAEFCERIIDPGLQVVQAVVDIPISSAARRLLLAVAFARLLYWTDPGALPQDRQTAWSYYLPNWRPGKPDQQRWNVTAWAGSLCQAS